MFVIRKQSVHIPVGVTAKIDKYGQLEFCALELVSVPTAELFVVKMHGPTVGDRFIGHEILLPNGSWRECASLALEA